MFHIFITIITLATAAFLLLFVFSTANQIIKRKLKDTHPYRRRPLLTAKELEFYHLLRRIVNGRAVILAKVSLGDLFEPTRNKQFFQNRISRRHVDFLICDPTTMEPRCGIDLDHSQPNDPAAQEREHLKNGLFEVTELSLIRITADAWIQPADLEVELAPHLNRSPGQINAGRSKYGSATALSDPGSKPG